MMMGIEVKGNMGQFFHIDRFCCLLIFSIVLGVSSRVCGQDSGTKCPLLPQPQKEIVKAVLKNGREIKFIDGQILVRFRWENITSPEICHNS
jgi:hypothetical protein